MTSFEEAKFPLTLDDGAAVERLRALAPAAVVCTMADPWSLVVDEVPAPAHYIESGSVELAHLRQVAEAVPPGAAWVIGLGGGSSIDTAKFVAEATGLPLVQIPSIISVDAAFTTAYGYRDGSRVRYAGELRPKEVIADPTLIRRAPEALNRAGVGDLLSCHTGMFDWRLAVDEGRGDIPWNEDAGSLGRRVLSDMKDIAPEIARVTPEAVRWLARTHRDVGAGCVAYGARFEEGSEHFLAYCIEWLTSGHWAHGELICACVLAMAFVQGNDPDLATTIVRTAGVNARPSHLGIDDGLLARALTELPTYCRREQLWPSVVEAVHWSPALIREVVTFVGSATGD